MKVLLFAAVVVSCDRSSSSIEQPDPASSTETSTRTPAPAATPRASAPTEAPPGTPKAAELAASTESLTPEPFELRVGPHVVRMPPAELKIVGDDNDGLVVLTADSGRPLADGINALFLQMNLELDSARPWTVGTWRYRLAAAETETSEGIYLGGPDNQLRPLEVEVEVVRSLLPGTNRVSRRVEVVLAGRFIPAEVSDPLNAPVFEVAGRFTAIADRP